MPQQCTCEESQGDRFQRFLSLVEREGLLLMKLFNEEYNMDNLPWNIYKDFSIIKDSISMDLIGPWDFKIQMDLQAKKDMNNVIFITSDSEGIPLYKHETGINLTKGELIELKWTGSMNIAGRK